MRYCALVGSYQSRLATAKGRFTRKVVEKTHGLLAGSRHLVPDPHRSVPTADLAVCRDSAVRMAGVVGLGIHTLPPRGYLGYHLLLGHQPVLCIIAWLFAIGKIGGTASKVFSS